MENQEQNIRSWDDLIFENRNKAYGAYALRHDYSTELIKSFITSIGVAVVVLVAAGISNTSGIVEKVVDMTKPITIGPPPTIKTEVIPPAQRREPVRQVTRSLPPVAVTTPDPVESKPEPAETSTGQEGTIEGTATSTTGTSTGIVDTGTDSGGVVKNNEYTHVEVMPAYKTGYEGMIKVLRKNLRYPGSAKKMGKEGTVYVQFVVSDEGEIRDVKVLTGFDKDCDREAVRVVEKLTEWSPGFQNKMAVNVRLVLPIRFKLDPM